MKVNRADLLKAMETVRRAVATEGTLPLLTNFLFDEGEITATDMDIGIVTEFPMFEGQQFLVPADRFYKLISSLPHETIDMELDDDGILIKGEGHRSKLAVSVVPDDFPRVRREFDEWREPPFCLADALEICLRSTDEAKGPEFGAIMWGKDGFVSSNTFFVSWCPVSEEAGACPEEPILLTAKFAREAVRLGQPSGWVIPMVEDEETGELRREGKICFQYEHTQLTGQLVDAEFPSQWKGYFPAEVPETMIAFDKDVRKMLERVGKFSEGDLLAAKAGHELTTITVDKKRMVISYEDSQGGILERLKLRGAEACSFQVDSALLVGALSNCVEGAHVDVDGRPMLYLQGEGSWPRVVMSVVPVEVK